MAKSKTYEMLLKIKGKTDSSLNSACLEAAKNLDTLGSAAKAAGTAAATALAGVATAAAGVAASSLSAYSEFEAAMDSTAVTARASAEEYELMEAAAREMGAKTTKTATEAAEAMGYMALAGWDVEQSMAGLEPILRASEATGMDLARCSDLVTDSMSALGLEVADMTDYLDLAVQAQQASNTTVESLLEAFIGCGGAAKTAGVDMDDLSTVLGVLANNGTKGSEAGTALNSMLSRMTTNSAALSAFEDLGVAVFDSTGNFRGLETVLGDTSAALSTLSDAERLAYMKNIAGTNYFTEMSYLLDAVAGGADGAASAWSTLETDIMDHSGVLLEVAQANTDNLAGATAIFQSAVSELQLQIGEQLAPYAKEGLEYLANDVIPVVSEKLGEIIPMVIEGGKALWENRNTILAVGSAVATAVGAFKGLQVASAGIGAVKNLSTILGAASKNGSLMTKVVSAFSLKFVLIAGIVAAVAAAFVLLWNKSEKFRATVMSLLGKLQELGGSLMELGNSIWSAVAPALEKLGTAMLTAFERAVELLAPVAENIIGIFTGIVDFIGGALSGDWDKALTGLNGIFSSAMEGLGNLATAAFTAILEIGTSIWPAIDNAVQAGIASISSRFPVLGAVLGSLWSTVQKVWSNIQAILQNAIQFVQNVFSGNWSAAWQNVVNIFGSIFSTVATIAMAPLNALKSAIITIFSGVWERIKGVWNNVAGWFNQNVVTPLVNFFSPIVSVISGFFQGCWILIQAVWKAAATWFNTNVISPVVTVFSTIVGTVSGFFTALWGNIVTVWTTVSTWFNTNVIAPVVSVFSTIVESVGGFFAVLWGNIVAVWTAAGTWFSENVAAPINTAFQSISDFVRGVFNGLLGFVESMINGAIGAINSFVGGFSGIVEKAAGFIGVEWEGIGEIPQVSLPRLVTGGIVTAPTILEAGEGGEPEAGLPLAKLGDLLENLDRNRIEIPDPEGGNDTPFTKLVATIDRMIQENNGTDRDEPKPGTNDQGPPPDGGDKDPPPAGPAQPEGGGPTTIMYSPVFQFNGAAPTKEEAEETGRLSFAEFKRLHDKLEAEDRRKNLRTR